MKRKKIFKLLYALIFIISTLFISDNTVSATDTTVINIYEELKSEYNFLKSKQLLTKSNDVTSDLKDAQNEITHFQKHIYELKELPVEELKRYNYNANQIKAIKTYDGSEEKSLLASATMTFSVKKNTLSYNSSTGLSTVKATVNFTWGGGAEEYGRDWFAMAYEADNNHNFKQITTVSSSLKYKEYKSPTNIKTWTKTATKKGDQGVTGSYGWDFPFKVKGDQYYAYLSSGSFSTTGVVSGKLKYFNVRYLYGHRVGIAAASLGISITNTGVSAGITLTPGTRFRGYPTDHGGIVTCS